VVNYAAWFPMVARLTDGKPRVVHPAEIKERSAHIAGKEQHWACGSAATELENVEGLQEAGFAPFRTCLAHFPAGRGLAPRRGAWGPLTGHPPLQSEATQETS
jgi:hypothetical protein